MILQKIGTKIYETAESDRRELFGITAPMVINICYDGELPTNNNNKKIQHFSQYMEMHKILKNLT